MRAREAGERRAGRLWDRNFTLICAATFAYFTSQTMQFPIFPAFLRERAGASPAVIGAFIGSFSVSGILLRPVVGRALGTRPRRRFMMLGGSIAASASALYLASRSLAFLVPLRIGHGVAVASFYTAAATLVADSAPPERRGEAISYFSMFLYVGLAGGGALGPALESGAGFGAVFGVSAVLALACVSFAGLVREPAARSPEAREAERHPLVNRAALFPGAVLALAAVGYASVLNFTADFAKEQAIGGRTLYFPVLAAAVIAVRLFGGRLADRFGRVAVAAPGLAAFAVSLAMLAAARRPATLLGSAVIGGAGFGLFFPSMMAFTIDRARPRERASAMGTFTAAFDAGYGTGSPVLGAIRGATDYPTMYRGAAAFTAAGLVVLVAGARRARSSGGAASASS